jgi:hypothetical protein
MPVAFQIRWIVDRMHVGVSNMQVLREFHRRMQNGIWTKQQRKTIYRMALKAHRDNQLIYNFVTGSI